MGQTNIAQALETTRRFVFDPSLGDRADAPNVVILVTDGRSNVEAAEVPSEAAQLKATGTSHAQCILCAYHTALMKDFRSHILCQNLMTPI